MRRKDQFDRDALHFAPFVLFPTSFPRDEFYKSVKLQQVLNELMHKVLFVEELLYMYCISVGWFVTHVFYIYVPFVLFFSTFHVFVTLSSFLIFITSVIA